MNGEAMIIAGPLARAARILCQVSAADVAAQAEIDKADLKDYEKCRDDLTSEQERRLVHALEHYGAHFIPDGDDGGYGVRLRFNRLKGRAGGGWGHEGGAAGAGGG